METIAKTIVNVMAITFLSVGLASANPWKNVEDSFNKGFSDSYPRPGVSWTQVAASFDKGFNDGYVAPEREQAVARVVSETDMHLLALVSFERMLGEDLYYQDSGRSGFELATLGWDDTISKAELYAGSNITVAANR